MSKFDLIFAILRIPFDFFSVLIAAFLAYYLRPFTDFIPFIQIPFVKEQLISWEAFFIFSIYAALFFIILNAINGAYNLSLRKNYFEEFFKILVNIAIFILGIISFYALFKVETFFSRGVLFIMSILIFIFTQFFRYSLNKFEKYFLKQGIGVKKIALWGKKQLREHVVKAIQNDPKYQLTYENETFDKKTHQANELWFIKSEHNNEGREILEFAQVNHLTYRFIPDVYGTLHAKVKAGTLGNFPLLTIQATSLEGWGQICKRIFDIICSVFILFLLAPILIFIIIAIKLDSPGPIFYISQRIGKNEKKFHVFKFRSMVNKADNLKNSLQEKNHRKNTPLFKIKNDPRITRFGKFLRRYSLDELPQFLNVLFGDMSIIGPRPHLPEEVQKYSLDQKRVLMIKPGITGLAQVSGRSDLNFTKEVQLDLHYIVNWSFLLDLKIFCKTPFIMLQGNGAD